MDRTGCLILMKTGRQHPLSIKLRALHINPSRFILGMFWVIRGITLFYLSNVLVPFFHWWSLLITESPRPLEAPPPIEAINDSLPNLLKLTPV